MSISITILLIVIFSFLTFFIAYFFGSSIFKKKYGDLNELELKIVDAKRRLETSKKEVEREIESFRKEETLKVKEELLNEKKIADDEIKKMKSELATKEERIAKKEETLETKMERLEEREAKNEKYREKLFRREKELEEMIANEEKELERISELTQEDARKIILTKLENELDHDKAVLIRDYEHNLDREEEDFSLEVSSCGISAPLVLERQYTKNIGREVEVKTATTSHTGVIKVVSNGQVTLEVTSRQPKPQGKGKITVTEEILLPIEEIKEAKLKLKF